MKLTKCIKFTTTSPHYPEGMTRDDNLVKAKLS